MKKSSRSSKARARLTPRCREEDKDRLRLMFLTFFHCVRGGQTKGISDPTQNMQQHKLHLQHDAVDFPLLLLVHFVPFPYSPLRVWNKVAAGPRHFLSCLRVSQSALLFPSFRARAFTADRLFSASKEASGPLRSFSRH